MIHLSRQQLKHLIDHDDDFTVSPEFRHLDTCTVCQQRLSTLSGDGEWMEEWLDAARGDTCDLSARHCQDIASSIVIAVDSTSHSPERVALEPVRLDFLDPPRHPELLGRLGRYDIERMIGMGGFGIVFKSRDSELNRVVAIKVLAPHLMSSSAARKRFAREAQASAAVVHDHVVPIYDVVSTEDTCYFVMQYISGRSLQERVDRDGPLPAEEILRIATQTAAGLHAAHEQGLIHRDVKPGNILLEDTVDRVLISDFGLARAADDASLTRSGAITGTPHYMSPEQAQGESIDPRSDLFSLGSVIYFMATGHSPFRAERMMAVLNRICHTPHRPLTEVRHELPIELSAIVERLLHKSASSRFESADQVRDVLSRTLGDLQSGRIRPRRVTTDRRSLRNRSWSAAVLLFVVALLLTGSWILAQWSQAVSSTQVNANGVVADSMAGGAGRDLVMEAAPSDRTAADLLAVPDALASEFSQADATIRHFESTWQLPTTAGTDSAWESEITQLHRQLGEFEKQLAIFDLTTDDSNLDTTTEDTYFPPSKETPR